MSLQLFTHVAYASQAAFNTINKNMRYDHIAPVCFASGLIAYPSITLSSIVMLEAIIVYTERRTLLSLPNGNANKIGNIVFGFILLCSCILPLLTSFELKASLIMCFFVLKLKRYGKRHGFFMLMEYIFIYYLLIRKSIDIGIIMVALYIVHTIYDISQKQIEITNNYIKFAISCLMHLSLAMFYFPYHIMQMNAFCLLLIIGKAGLVWHLPHQGLDPERSMNPAISASLMRNYQDILRAIHAAIDRISMNDRQATHRLLARALSRNDIAGAVIENLDADYLDTYREIESIFNPYRTNYLIFYCDFVNLDNDEQRRKLSELDDVKNSMIAMIKSSHCLDTKTFKKMLSDAFNLLSSIQMQDGIYYKAWQKIHTILVANQSDCKHWLKVNTPLSNDNIRKQLIQFYSKFVASQYTLRINFDCGNRSSSYREKLLRKKQILCLDKESFIRFNDKLSSHISQAIFDPDLMRDWFDNLELDEIPPDLTSEWNAITAHLAT